MTPDEIYDKLGLFFGCLMEGCGDDVDCSNCDWYLGDDWNAYNLILAAQSLIGQMRWTPVTETLPPADEWVLVTVQNMLGQTWVQRAEYSHSKEIWSDGKYGISGVTAWQKLPEPYDGGAENG